MISRSGVALRGGDQGAEPSRNAQPRPVSRALQLQADAGGGGGRKVTDCDLIRGVGKKCMVEVPSARVHGTGCGDAVRRAARREGRGGEHRDYGRLRGDEPVLVPRGPGRPPDGVRGCDISDDPRGGGALASAGPLFFRLVSLHGARSAAGKKPPAMRVRVEGSALASKRRQSGYDTGVQVVSARKGGRFGKQGTQPVAHEVDVQVPHRVHTEV